MTGVMIRGIKKIDNYRIFQRWTWKQSGDDTFAFARVNLMYGQNGSGKSTLANLIGGCAIDEASAVNAGLVLDVQGTDGKNREVGADSYPDFWKRIRVFNRDFVQQNLAFAAEEGPHPQALLTIGEKSVAAEEQLKRLHLILNKTQADLEQAKRAVDSAEKALKKRLTDVARSVVDSLLGTKVSEYKPRSYNSTKIARLFGSISKDPSLLKSASRDLEADRMVATREPMAQVVFPARQKVLGLGALAEARALLAKNVVVEVLESLRGQPERSAWVQQGLPLHDHREDCLFCGQPLTAQRRHELAAHFDDSFRSLQRNISVLIEGLDNSVRALRGHFNALPQDVEVYPDLRAELQQARDIYERECRAYSQNVAKMVAALKEKKADPLSNVPLESGLMLTVPDTVGVEKIIAEHAEKVRQHEEQAHAAARRVELYHLKNFADEYQKLKSDAEWASREVQRLEGLLSGFNGEVIRLENVEADPIPGAEELTACVSRLLGRNDLKFSTASDGKRYVIERHGVPATNLSEGEQTAIALLYFLISVRKDKINGEPPIVIIDDPVSSLDSGILFGASSYIWSELVTNTYVSQLFLMTHNFELFRQWLIQMESVPRKARNDQGGYSACEIRSAFEVDHRGRAGRKPQILHWALDDRRKKKLRSHYHFLFSEVANSLLNVSAGHGVAEQMEIMGLMPNAARRMLESFLAFRLPEQMGSFHGSMRAVLDGHPGLDASVRTHVERYLHAYSHLEEGDLSRPLNLIESTAVLRSLFQLMYHVDSQHVSAMCKALDIDKDNLVGELNVTSPDGMV